MEFLNWLTKNPDSFAELAVFSLLALAVVSYVGYKFIELILPPSHMK